MSSAYKPPNHNALSPYLVVNGATDAIAFMQQVFDATELESQRMSRKDGTLKHAEVLIDDTVVMLGDAQPGWPAVATHIHVYVKDVDKVFKKAVDCGGTVVEEPCIQDDSKRGGVKDPCGTTWWVSTIVP